MWTHTKLRTPLQRALRFLTREDVVKAERRGRVCIYSQQAWSGHGFHEVEKARFNTGFVFLDKNMKTVHTLQTNHQFPLHDLL